MDGFSKVLERRTYCDEEGKQRGDFSPFVGEKSLEEEERVRRDYEMT